MRTLIYLSAGILLVFYLIQKAMAAANGKVERQPFRLISREGKFELRDYPSAIMATVHSPREGEGRSTNSNFRRLAGYIFGGNASSEKIAMTAPVHMSRTEQGNTMQFVMPSSYDMKDLPRPLDPSITLDRSEGGLYAAVVFGGFADEKTTNEKERELKAWLDKKNFDIVGPVELLGYNAPYEILGRRNEVLVKVVERKAP